MPDPVIYVANVSSVQCDGEVIPGLQSIDYKVVREHKIVHNIGIDELIGLEYGPMFVAGTLRVRSAYPPFDEILTAEVPRVKSFQLVVELKRGGESLKTLTFDDCYIKDKTYTMDAGGVAISEYTFTAARLREQ